MAHARVLLNDQIQLTSLRLYDGADGLFVSYPNDPTCKADDYRQIFYPITRELRDAIELAVIKEYEAATVA
jgi:stage V sporulation protein G